MSARICDKCGSECFAETEIKNRYVCLYCGSEKDIEDISEMSDKVIDFAIKSEQEIKRVVAAYGETVIAAFETSELRKVYNLRCKINDEVNATNIDGKKIINSCEELLKYIGKDYLAELYISFYKKSAKDKLYLSYLEKDISKYSDKVINTAFEFVLENADIVYFDEICKYAEKVSVKLCKECSVLVARIHEKIKQKQNEASRYLRIPRDVFICHKSKDEEKGEYIRQQLKNNDISSFFAPYNLSQGSPEDYWVGLKYAIANCKYFVVVSSVFLEQSFTQGLYVNDALREIEYCANLKNSDIKRIEIKIDDPKNYSRNLLVYTFMDGHGGYIHGWKDFEAGVTLLIQHIAKLKLGINEGNAETIKLNEEKSEKNKANNEFVNEFLKAEIFLEEENFAEVINITKVITDKNFGCAKAWWLTFLAKNKIPQTATLSQIAKDFSVDIFYKRFLRFATQQEKDEVCYYVEKAKALAEKQAEQDKIAEAERKAEQEKKNQVQRVKAEAIRVEAEAKSKMERAAQAERREEDAKKAEAERIIQSAQKAEAMKKAEAALKKSKEEKSVETARAAEAQKRAEALLKKVEEDKKAADAKKAAEKRNLEGTRKTEIAYNGFKDECKAQEEQPKDSPSDFIIEKSVLKKYNGNKAHVVIPNGVTSIGVLAFYDKSLQTIKIPDSVKIINAHAFSRCFLLREVEIPDGVENIYDGTFTDCTRLQSVKMPKDAISIGEWAFSGCSSLERINIQNGMKSIKKGAFCGCENLQNIEIPNSVTSIDGGAFNYCLKLTDGRLNDNYTIRDGILFSRQFTELVSSINFNEISYVVPDSVEKICHSAFYKCNSLQIIEIPDSVIAIENDAFFNCGALKEIRAYCDRALLNERVTRACFPRITKLVSHGEFKTDEASDARYFDIENGVLKKYKGIRPHVVIPDGVTSIGEAFKDCTHLKSVKLPIGLISIGDFAFYHCINLQSIEIPNSVTHIGDNSFRLCERLQKVEIPNSVISIGHFAFKHCKSITSVKMSSNVKTIGVETFFGCESLQNIVMPNGVEHIDSNAFSRCKMLKSIDIPISVTRIDKNVFSECSSLEEIRAYCSASLLDISALGGCKAKVIDYNQIMKSGLCMHCGGSFKGLFTKVCSNCGKKKDY